MADKTRTITAQCDYCDPASPATTVTHFPHQSLSVCSPHLRLYPEVAAKEATYS